MPPPMAYGKGSPVVLNEHNSSLHNVIAVISSTENKFGHCFTVNLPVFYQKKDGGGTMKSISNRYNIN